MIGVTSCERRVGVSTIASLVAINACRTWGEKILLVDANIQHPSLQCDMEVSEDVGLADFVTGQAELEQCIHSISDSSLQVMPAGTRLARAAMADQIASLESCMKEIRGSFDTIICDFPPVSEHNLMLECGTSVDGTLIVLESGKAKRDLVERAKVLLNRAGVSVLGVVFNG